MSCSDSLNDGGDAHAAADAERDERRAEAAPLELAGRLRHRDVRVLIDSGAAGEPEDVVASDRVLQGLGVAWVIPVAIAVFL